MSELSLPRCPICHAKDSLSRETMEREGQHFVWYECAECGSVLLWLGDDQWAYQEVGLEDKAHLSKQPLTVTELQELLPRTKKDTHAVAITDEATRHLARPESRSPAIRLLPLILVMCLVGFVGFVAIAAYEAFTGSPVFPTATPTAPPTPMLMAGTEVKLAEPDGGAVTVWQIGTDCEPSHAFGEVPSGLDARVLDEACYHDETQMYYHRVRMDNESTGWVRADKIIPTDQYKPPTATPTPKPKPTARAIATKRTSVKWAGVYIGMPADDVLKIHPKSEAVAAPEVLGSDSEGQIVKWTYPGAFLILARREGQGTDSLGHSKCYRVIEIHLR